MSPRLMVAVVCIMFALIFYTTGVWMEHIKKELQVKHAVLFCIGLVFDTTGTFLMSTLQGIAEPGALLSAHAITGYIAIVLMFVHAIWAIVVLTSKKVTMKANFHKFSLFVWIVWLIPFMIGMMMGMKG